MPAGLPYFAWTEASETTFEAAHMRWDESIFSFELAQDEGDPASLTVVVRRPRNEAGDPIGLLGPGRKIWAWFALDCGGGELTKFRGRLVGVPTSIFEELVTLEFVARALNVVAQKTALADTLRVLPHYDPVMIEKSRRDDPDVVLEGYTKIWHYDRETLAVTVSDEITGEDGLVEFDGASEDGKVLYDGLGLTLTSGPLSRVDIKAEFTWTQQAFGVVDLTDYLTSNWPGSHNGIISSYTLYASDWPKNGAGIGDGWEVAESTARDLYDLTVKSHTETIMWHVKLGFGQTSRTTYTVNTSYIGEYTFQDNITGSEIVLSDEYSTTFGADGAPSSLSRSVSLVRVVLPMQAIQVSLVAGYKAGRQCTEQVSLSLLADVQHVLTDPEDGEALRIDDIRSVNLSDPEEGTPIGDPRRRSYIATERGNQSVEHLIALARAHLMKRARVVEIAFAPKLSRMPEITLRKNAFLVEPRVGEALGKIIGYSVALDGSDGRINCEVRIGCTIGRGGSAVAAGGTPTYCSTDYTGFDYQQFVGRTILFDTSVGYQPPNADPNDDGVEFLSVLRPQDVIETPLVVTFGPEEQKEGIQEELTGNFLGGSAASIDYSGPGFTNPEAMVAATHEYYKNILKQYETHATFKLKSMTREFATPYEIQVTDLKIPTGIDLEAA